MQSFYPPPRGSGDSGNSAELPPSQPGVGIPRRGHSGLVSQAAAAAVASGSGTGQASYCSPGLWLGSDRSGLGQSSSLPWTNTRTNSTNHGNQANKKGRANKPQGQLIGDSLEVTYQERLTGFGPHQVSELVELIEARHTQFSALSLCTALHRLATGSLSSLGKVEHRCAGLISTLETQLRLQPDRFRAQSIANACWAVAKLPWAKPLLPVLLETAARRMQQFKGQELSLLLWSMATSESKMQGAVADATNGIVQEFLERGSSAFDAQSTATVAYSAGALLVTHEPLWDAIGTGSASRVSEFSDRQLANLVWGFATVSYADCTVVFERVAKEAPIATLAPIDLSLVAWSLAKVSQGEQDFYDQVADAIVAKHEAWKYSDTRNIATLLYSLALAEQAVSHQSAFHELAMAVCQRTKEFSVQGLTNAVWAYSTACYMEERWFNIVGKEVVQRRDDEFEPLDVANTLWAFAAVLHHDSNVISRLTSLGKVMMSELSAQNLAITAWSLAALETRDVSFFKQAADPFVLRLQECKAQELNNMLWAYATVNFRLPWLFLKSANHAISLGLAEFKTHELSIMLWAHGTAGVCNHEFFDQVVDEILGGRGIHSCAPREIANSAWAYSTIIGRCHVPWMTAVAQYSRSHVNEFDMQGIGNILWSFANVSTYSEALLHEACEETARRCHKDEASHNVAQVLSAMQAAGLQEVRLCEAAIDLFLRRGFVGGIGAREFLILGNAALPMANILHERWTNLKALLEEHIFRPLTEAIPPRHGMADWSQVETCISQLDIDHLGVGFTATFLKNIGVLGSVQVHQSSHIGCSWIQEAAQACALERERAIQAGAEENAPAEQQKLVRQLDKVNKREIVAWVRYQISLDGLKHAEHGRAFSWRLEAEMSQTRVAQLLKPMMTKSRMAPNMIGEHDRSGHAERCALLQVASDWLQTGPERGLEVHGEMFLYVTHYPCVSCVFVIAQFARLFPHLSLHLAYADGRAMHTQPLERKA